MCAQKAAATVCTPRLREVNGLPGLRPGPQGWTRASDFLGGRADAAYERRRPMKKALPRTSR